MDGLGSCAIVIKSLTYLVESKAVASVHSVPAGGQKGKWGMSEMA